MKRRRFISFVFVLILCFGMSGCGKEKKTTAPNKFQSDYMEVWGGTTVEEGDFRVINGLLYFSRRGCRGKSDVFFKGCSGKTRRSYHRNENGYSNVRIEF